MLVATVVMTKSLASELTPRVCSVRSNNAEATKEALHALKAMIRAEQPFDTDIVERIEKFFRTLSDDDANGDLVQGLLDVQLVLYQEMQYRRAVPAGLKAVRWARQLGDRALLAKALTFQALSAGENFDLSLSFEAYVEALQIAREIGDTYLVAVSYSSLAGVMRRLGRDRASMSCIQAALDWSGDQEGKFRRVRACALGNLADFHLKQKNWLEALDAARSAQAIIHGHDSTDSVLHAVVISNEVSAHVRLTNFECAKDAVERLATLNKQHPSAASECYLRQATALYESFVGNPALAADSLSEFRHVPIMRDTALPDLIDMYERAGEPSKALEVTRELLEYLRSARREVTEADLGRISIAPVDDVDNEILDLIRCCGRFEVEANRLSDKLHAKLAYLFELGVSAELREEDAANAGEHIFRVGRLCAALAIESGYGQEMCWLAEVAGRSHDVGKTSLPSHIVLKTEPLSDGERDLLRSHSEDGAALITQLADARLVQVVAAVRHHHEQWNGSGYPRGLKGEEIPILARIVAICDSFDAMTHARPFRAARSLVDSLVEIERCAGSQFDPGLAGQFVSLMRRLQRENSDLDDYLGESGRRTRWAKSHPELLRLLESRVTP
jgi:putative two-component system response regulator